jgi:hypothetical protein
MATILDKDLTRESTVKYDNREIQVILTADQQIAFKLKGMKSGVLSIGIDELYKQLKGDTKDEASTKSGSVVAKRKSSEDIGSPMISLNKLRSLSLISNMNYNIKIELERVICELLNQEISLTE